MINRNKSKKLQESDLKSIEEICKVTWEPLYRYIYYKVQNREEAEDVIQETYVKALSYPNFGNVDSNKYIAFFKTVAMNIIRDRWRKSQVRGIRVNFDSINPMEISTDDTSNNTTQQIFIENALKELNDEQRKVIELRIIEGYSVAETAKIMDKKEGNIRVIQYRALQNLAEIIDENDKEKGN